MAIPEVGFCGICKNVADQPLVCKKCIRLWADLFGKKGNRKHAEESAQKVKMTYEGMQHNPLTSQFKK